MPSKILLFCGSGYVFREVFQPIIEQMAGTCSLSVLMTDFYVGEETLAALNQLKQQGKIHSYQLVASLRRPGESVGVYHRRLKGYIDGLEKDFDLLVSGSDFLIFDHYLMHALRPRGRIVVIQVGTLIRALKEYRQRQGVLSSEAGKRAVPGWGVWGKGLGKVRRSIVRGWVEFQNRYFYPWLYARTFFPAVPLDRLAFFSGHADAVICYDPLEREALEALTGNPEKVRLARHPAQWWAGQGEVLSAGPKKLLVLFSGNLAQEMDASQLSRWIEVVTSAASLGGVQNIDARFHPRMSPDMLWPGKFIQALAAGGHRVRVVDALKNSLIDSLGGYVGVIGGPSGALRVAHAVNPRIFVIGLANCSDRDQNDQDWILGKAEGIVWLGPQEKLRQDHFEFSQISSEAGIPSLVEVLKTYLN